MNDLSYTPKGHPQQFPQMTLFEAPQLHMFTPVVESNQDKMRRKVKTELAQLRKRAEPDEEYVPELAKRKKEIEREPDPKDFYTFEEFIGPLFYKRFHIRYDAQFEYMYNEQEKEFVNRKREDFINSRTS